MIRAIIFACLLLLSMAATAHKPSDSYLSLTATEQGIQGQWDIALRDLDYAVGLDDNGNRTVTWNELQRHHADIAAYALARLHIKADGQDCGKTVTKQQVARHSDGTYSVLRFAVTCPDKAQRLVLRYQLFFDLDPSHRGLFKLTREGQTETAVFNPEHSQREFVLREASPWQEFIDFAREGVWHIWIGYDHILFLISLLLPSVVFRNERAWQAVSHFRPAFTEVLKVVTAFTVAHSITLTLAVLGIINLPSRWVESAIAASVMLAALNNLFPLITRRLWLYAFCFGLVHGLGFASVLADLGLPQDSLILALVAFNVGVEIGQFAIVSAFLPLAFWLRNSWFYQRLTLGLGSWLIAGVALIWLLDRSLELSW